MLNALGDILKYKQKKSPLMRGVVSALAVKAANDFLRAQYGSQMATLAQAAYARGDTLSIACLSSVAAQEIKLKEAELIDAVNLSTGGQIIKKIKYLS